MKLLIRPCLFAVAFQAASVLAQDSAQSSADFNLFETLDSNSTNNSASASSGARPGANGRGTRNTQANPTFTLVGTSKIGSRQTAILKHFNGEIVRVPLNSGTRSVPGHELYSVVNHGAGQIALQFPAAVPCGDFPDQGVSCDSTNNISILNLTTADAIALPNENLAAAVVAEAADEEAIEESQPNSQRNPFAALRDRNRNAVNNQATSTQRFEPRRIDPADVPPGMRVVSTPFGDRLVNIND